MAMWHSRPADAGCPSFIVPCVSAFSQQFFGFSAAHAPSSRVTQIAAPKGLEPSVPRPDQS